MSVGQIRQTKSCQRFPGACLECIIHLSAKHHFVRYAAGIQLIVNVLHDKVAEEAAFFTGKTFPVSGDDASLLSNGSYKDFCECSFACSVFTTYDRYGSEWKFSGNALDSAFC